jgi:phenylpyruvate tautomerase PptA (4-oxalocrotonate tautomerase family)
MPRYQCLSSTPIDTAARGAIVDGLTGIEAAQFGTKSDALRVDFVEVKEGQWFTAAESSKATVLSGTVPDGTSQEVRAVVMDEIGRMAAVALDKDFNDIMVVASDGRRD